MIIWGVLGLNLQQHCNYKLLFTVIKVRNTSIYIINNYLSNLHSKFLIVIYKTKS